MLTKEKLQMAITIASQSGLGAVAGEAFMLKPSGWVIRPGCLSSYYSSGERIACGILLVLYWELYGSRNGVVIPEDAEYDHHPVDLVWPGAWFFLKAIDNLTDETAWAAIKMLLPKSRTREESC
jgi:hypothetical protein